MQFICKFSGFWWKTFQEISKNLRKFRTSAGGPGAATPERGGFSRTNGDSFKKISIELLFFKEGFLTNLLNFSRKWKIYTKLREFDDIIDR